jgi:predicted transcriptional regulator
MAETEKTFVSGLYLNRVHENAPAFIITNQEIHVEKFITWLTANKHLANDKGYLKIVGKESEKLDDKGNPKRYFEVDRWMPKEKAKEVQTGAPEYPAEDITPEDIPFN